MDLIRQRDFGIQQIVPQLTLTADSRATGVGGSQLPVGPFGLGSAEDTGEVLRTGNLQRGTHGSANFFLYYLVLMFDFLFLKKYMLDFPH